MVILECGWLQFHNLDDACHFDIKRGCGNIRYIPHVVFLMWYFCIRWHRSFTKLFALTGSLQTFVWCLFPWFWERVLLWEGFRFEFRNNLQTVWVNLDFMFDRYLKVAFGQKCLMKVRVPSIDFRISTCLWLFYLKEVVPQTRERKQDT